jgi:glycerol kinase
MRNDGQAPLSLRVDGGMVQNNWLCSFLADILGVTVERPIETETTALGAAYLAGLQVGVYDSIESVGRSWQSEKRFSSSMESLNRNNLLTDWRSAVEKVKT